MYKPISKEIFHVHTWRCKHAGAFSDVEYIEKAIRLGAYRIVFTDHAPFPGNPFGNRMDYEQLPKYIASISKLKEKYKDKIEILCGLEVEYLPSFDEYIHELRNMPGIDVMVLGQHFYEHEAGSYSFSDADKSMEYKGLIDAMIAGIETYCFDVVAHPDRAFRRRKQFAEAEIEATKRFGSTIKQHAYVILEQNLSSKRRKRQYWPEFWQLVNNKNIIVGYDAHSLEELELGWRESNGEE